MIVYLSGPISSDPNHAEKFIQASLYVMHLGQVSVLNPAAEAQPPDWEWADFIMHDLALLRQADVLVRLPGADSSPGSRVEYEFARGLKIRIVDLADVRSMLAELGSEKRGA